jgi:hypothetical protein
VLGPGTPKARKAVEEAIDTEPGKKYTVVEPDCVTYRGGSYFKFEAQVVFIPERRYFDLDVHWARHLLEPSTAYTPMINHKMDGEPSNWYIFNGGNMKHVTPWTEPMPAGLRSVGIGERYVEAEIWHVAWFARLCTRNKIEHRSTHPEVDIDETIAGLWLTYTYIRLAIDHEGSVIVPMISQWILNDRRGRSYWDFQRSPHDAYS